VIRIVPTWLQAYDAGIEASVLMRRPHRAPALLSWPGASTFEGGQHLLLAKNPVCLEAEAGA